MNVDVGIDVVLGVVCSALGWWLRVLWEAQMRLQRDLAELERAMPSTYVRRDDFSDTVERLIKVIDRLEMKFDKLLEK